MTKWSLPSSYQQTGVHHGYRTAEHRGDPPFSAVKAWYGRLEPGGFIVPHIDASPWFRRWHHPIIPSGYVWKNGDIRVAPLWPFQIRHWEPHAVWVPSDQPAREHLIVEYAEQIPGESGLVLCDMIEPVAELLERVT